MDLTKEQHEIIYKSINLSKISHNLRRKLNGKNKFNEEV